MLKKIRVLTSPAAACDKAHQSETGEEHGIALGFGYGREREGRAIWTRGFEHAVSGVDRPVGRAVLDNLVVTETDLAVAVAEGVGNVPVEPVGWPDRSREVARWGGSKSGVAINGKANVGFGGHSVEGHLWHTIPIRIE